MAERLGGTCPLSHTGGGGAVQRQLTARRDERREGHLARPPAPVLEQLKMECGGVVVAGAAQGMDRQTLSKGSLTLSLCTTERYEAVSDRSSPAL